MGFCQKLVLCTLWSTGYSCESEYDDKLWTYQSALLYEVMTFSLEEQNKKDFLCFIAYKFQFFYYTQCKYETL